VTLYTSCGFSFFEPRGGGFALGEGPGCTNVGTITFKPRGGGFALGEGPGCTDVGTITFSSAAFE